MKNYFFAVLTAIVSVSCYAKGDGFVVKGHITGFEEGILIVMERSPNAREALDTVFVKGGKFEYKGSVKSPTSMCFIPSIIGKDVYYGSFNMMVDNRTIEVEMDLKNLRKREEEGKISVKGSVSHPEYMRIEKLFEGIQPGQTDKYVEKILADKGFETNEIFPFFMFVNTPKEHVEQRDKYLKALSPELDRNIYVQYLKENVANEKTVQIGQVAPDFTLMGLDGKEYRLSDFRGQYVLFDFTASWCGWCKKETPYLKQVYEIGKDKDFVMLTVNLDKTKELWSKDAEERGTPWLMLSDLQAMKGGVAKLYNVSGIPQIFFIDKEGKILNNDLRGDEMIKVVTETLKK